MKLIIDRTKWLRGEDDSYLLRSRDNKMCCLGFYCLACGILEEDIIGKAEPVELINEEKFSHEKIKNLIILEYEEGVDLEDLDCDNSNVCDQLMSSNDNRKITENEREEEIAGLFASIDVDVEFTN